MPRANRDRRGPAWDDRKSGETASKVGAEVVPTKGAVARKSPAAGCAAGRWCSLVARFPEGDVGGAVFGRLFELDEPAADPDWAKFRLMRCTA